MASAVLTGRRLGLPRATTRRAGAGRRKGRVTLPNRVCEFGAGSGRILEGQAQRRAAPDTAFKTGARVFHMKFGPGSVVAADGPKLTVDFDRAGRKLVMDSFVTAEG